LIFTCFVLYFSSVYVGLLVVKITISALSLVVLPTVRSYVRYCVYMYFILTNKWWWHDISLSCWQPLHVVACSLWTLRRCKCHRWETLPSTMTAMTGRSQWWQLQHGTDYQLWRETLLQFQWETDRSVSSTSHLRTNSWTAANSNNNMSSL